MFRTSTKTVLAALIALPILGAAPAAFAQDAIMLEKIGAVRMATPIELQRRGAESAETMWFADARTTAYYALDNDHHAIVARFEPGPQGGDHKVVRRTIDDGAVVRFTVEGTGQNSIRITLAVRRHGDALVATVETNTKADKGAASESAATATHRAFHLPAVIGAAFVDHRIATNPEEVRRQGGFATAGAVLWLPAGAVTSEPKKPETTKLGPL